MAIDSFGLRELPVDDRDFLLGAYDLLPKLEDLPNAIKLPFTVKHQGNTDKCTAYASCAISEVQEKVELDPAYSFAASKEISGNVDAWGQDLRTACKSHVKYGALARKDRPVEISQLPFQEQRYYKTWKDLYPLALEHKKKSYFAITGPYDTFDNIRAALFKYQTPIIIGIQFGYPLTQKLIDSVKNGFGHAMTVIGYRTYEGVDTLIVGNSYGIEAGDNGVHYVTREVINHWASYGAFTFIDEDPDTVTYNKEHGIMKSDNWIIQLLKIFLNLFK